jgi:hypothetical protein
VTVILLAIPEGSVVLMPIPEAEVRHNLVPAGVP